MGELLAPGDMPDDFTYPTSFVRTIELGSEDLEPWWFLDGDRLRSRTKGLRKRYRKRTLVPFAERQDNDDVACFDVAEGNVCIVHDYADAGWERREAFVAFEDWLRRAHQDHVEFESE